MAKRRDSKAAYRRATEVSRLIGYASPYSQRRHGNRIFNEATLKAQPETVQQEYFKVLDAIGLGRRDDLLVPEAAAYSFTSPEAVNWLAKSAVEGDRFKSADRLYRPMYVFSEGRRVEISVRGSRKATEVSDYHRAVRRYLEGDPTALSRFEGRRVAGVSYETDPDALDELARRQQLAIEDIYQQVA